MRCKASLLFLTKLKQRLLWAFSYIVCVFSVYVMWHGIRHGHVYFYCDGMKANAINPVCSLAAGFGRARSQSVCALPIMWGVFRIKEFELTTKGQIKCARQQDVKRFCSRVFLHVSVCERFNMCRVFEPVCVCSKVRWSFISSQQKRAGVRFTWLSVHQVCLDAFNLLRVSVRWILHLRWRGKKISFCCLSAGKCLS